VKPGLAYSAIDDYAYTIITPEQKVHVHDLNATILHLMGIDDLRPTYPYQGREVRLTDVHGTMVTDILSSRSGPRGKRLARQERGPRWRPGRVPQGPQDDVEHAPHSCSPREKSVRNRHRPTCPSLPCDCSVIVN